MPHLQQIQPRTGKDQLRLYDSPHSPNARKVRATAAEIGLHIDRIPIDLLARGAPSSELLALNPNGKIPVLIHDGFVVWESNAILMYLAALRPGRDLHGLNPARRADVDRWLFWQVAHFSRPVAKVGFERLIKPELLGQAPNEAAVAGHMLELLPWLRVLEGALEKPQWIAGELSIADFALGAWAEVLSAAATLSDFPNIQAWLARLSSRDSWSKTQGELFEYTPKRRVSA